MDQVYTEAALAEGGSGLTDTLKVLIADDEPIAVQSLVFWIKGHFDSLHIAGTARTGKEAVEKAIELHPDLAIMDINMPGINGLDAIRKIKEMNPSISFIIITAYDYFDYAVESVSLGVEKYLLKPVKEAVFVKTLEMVTERIKQQKERMRDQLEQQERLKLAIPIIEASFVYSLCMFDRDNDDLERYCSLLGYEESSGYIMILDFSQYRDSAEASIDAHLEGEKLYDEYRRVIKSCCDCLVGPFMANQIVVYIFDKDNSGSTYEQKTRSINLAERIMERISRHSKDLHIGIGKFYTDVKDAKKSYRQAFNALQALHRLQDDEGEPFAQSRILHDDDISETTEGMDIWFEQAPEDEIFAKVPYEKEATILMLFDNVYNSLAGGSGIDFSSLKNRMIGLVVGFFKRWEAVMDSNYDVLHQIIQAKSKQELHMICRQFISSVLPKINGSKQKKANSIIEKADRFIEANYSQDISLEAVAREVNLSPYYFSRFYKEMTGQNFIDKLANIRIEKAKELLLDPELSIKDISMKVGFTDPNYFSKAFKKITGVTASDYRKLFDANAK